MNPTLCAVLIGDLDALRTLRKLGMLNVDSYTLNVAAEYGRVDVAVFLASECPTDADLYFYSQVYDCAKECGCVRAQEWAADCHTTLSQRLN